MDTFKSDSTEYSYNKAFSTALSVASVEKL